jgi:hypothetical protein
MAGSRYTTSVPLPSRCDTAPDVPAPATDDVENAKRRTDGIYCKELDHFAHEVIAMSVACMKGDREARNRVFKVLFCAYVALFLVGLTAFGAALYKGLMTNSDAATTGVFGGLSVATFAVLFLLRPLDMLRRNSIFLSWLNITTTSYWTRHYYLNQRGTLNGEIEEATNDTITHLAALLHERDPGASGTSENGARPADEFDFHAADLLPADDR